MTITEQVARRAEAQASAPPTEDMSAFSREQRARATLDAVGIATSRELVAANPEIHLADLRSVK